MRLPAPLDQQRLAKRLTKAVATYANSADIPHLIADRMLQRLNLVKQQPSTIIDAGMRDGYITRQLEKCYPKANIIGLDDVEAFLPASLKKKWWRKRALVCTQPAALPFANQSIDLYISNLWLQQQNDLLPSFQEAARVLTTDGLLFYTMLGVDTLKELRHSFAAADSAAHVHEFMDMHDVGDLLLQAGFADPVMDVDTVTLRYSTVDKLLNELKHFGASNARQDAVRGLMGKQCWAKMIASYERLRQDGKLPVTIEIIHGHAWMGEPKSLQSVDSNTGEVVIPITSISKRN